MAIQHELSSDIAVELLTRKQNQDELRHLKEVVFKIHKALQQMRADEIHRRFSKEDAQMRTHRGTS